MGEYIRNGYRLKRNRLPNVSKISNILAEHQTETSNDGFSGLELSDNDVDTDESTNENVGTKSRSSNR